MALGILWGVESGWGCGGDTGVGVVGGLAQPSTPGAANRRRHQLVLSHLGCCGWWREEGHGGADLSLDPPPGESGLQLHISGHQRKAIGGLLGVAKLIYR